MSGRKPLRRRKKTIREEEIIKQRMLRQAQRAVVDSVARPENKRTAQGRSSNPAKSSSDQNQVSVTCGLGVPGLLANFSATKALDHLPCLPLPRGPHPCHQTILPFLPLGRRICMTYPSPTQSFRDRASPTATVFDVGIPLKLPGVTGQTGFPLINYG